ncbi:MAG TPA: acyl-CoA dehydrogenase family protein [Chthoniobacterales bacterium]
MSPFDEPETVLARASEFADRCALSAEKPDVGARNLSLEFSWLREAGFLAVPIPREMGGKAWGLEPGTWRHLLRLLKIVGRGNLSVGRIYEGHVNALQLVLQWGTSAQIEAAGEDVQNGCLFGVWNTEAPNDGLSLAEVGSSNQRFRLSGAKTFASGASILQRVFANAATAGGWQMCLVPLDQVKVARDADSWQPLGMRATESIRVDFDGVEVDGTTLFGEPGDYNREPWFSGGAIRFAAVQLGGAEAIAEASRHFLQQENRIKDPQQAIRAGEMAALLQSGDLWLEGAASRAETAAACPDELVAYAGLMRRTIERIGLEVIEHAVRSSGARALLRPNPLERLVRDLTMYLRQPVPDFVLMRAGQFILKSEKHFDTLWRRL